MDSVVNIQFIATGNDNNEYTNNDLGGCVEWYYAVPTKKQVIEDMEQCLYYLQEDVPEEVIFTKCKCNVLKGEEVVEQIGLQKEYKLEATLEKGSE